MAGDPPCLFDLRFTGMKADFTSVHTPSDIPAKAENILIHEHGDFLSQAEFDEWVDVAKAKPNVNFYSLTHALNFWVRRMKDIPNNLHLCAAIGGNHDHLIWNHALPFCRLVDSRKQAMALSLPVELDKHEGLFKKMLGYAILKQDKIESAKAARISDSQASSSAEGKNIRKPKKPAQSSKRG